MGIKLTYICLLLKKINNKDKPETNENLESKRMKLLFAYLFIQFLLLNLVNVFCIKSIKILKANPDDVEYS